MFTRKLTRSEYASLPPDEQIRYRGWVHNGAVPETSEDAEGTESETVSEEVQETDVGNGEDFNLSIEEEDEPIESDDSDSDSDSDSDEEEPIELDESEYDSDASVDDEELIDSDDSDSDSDDEEPIEEAVDSEEPIDEVTDNKDFWSDFDSDKDDFSFDNPLGIDTKSLNDDSEEDTSFDDIESDYSDDTDTEPSRDDNIVFNDADVELAENDKEVAEDDFSLGGATSSDSSDEVDFFADLDANEGNNLGSDEDDSSTDSDIESDIYYDDIEDEEIPNDSNSHEPNTEDEEAPDDLESDIDSEDMFADSEEDTDSNSDDFVEYEDTDEEPSTKGSDKDDALFATEEDGLFADDDSTEEDDLFADDSTSEDEEGIDSDEDNLFADDKPKFVQALDSEVQAEAPSTDEVIDESDWSFDDDEDDLFGTDTIISSAVEEPVEEEPISEQGIALASAISEFTGADMYANDTPIEQGTDSDDTLIEQGTDSDDTPIEQDGTETDEVPNPEPEDEKLDELTQAISDFGLDAESELEPAKVEQKPKKLSAKKPKTPKEPKPPKKKNKVLLRLGIVLLVALIALVAFIAFKFFTKGSSYANDLNSILDANTGTFNYKFTVTSSSVGDSSDSNSKTANALGKEATTTSKGDRDDSKSKNTWTSDSDLATNYWDSPNYIVEVRGQKESAEKYSATIFLTTKDKSGELTDILVDGNTTYINAGKLMSYLSSTSDAYLHNLGKDLNLNTSAYIKCKSSDLAFDVFGLSNDASAMGITQKIDRVALVRQMLASTLGGHLTTDTKSNTDGTVLNLSAKDTDGVLDSIRSIAQNSADVYDSYISNAETLYSKDGYKVAKANKSLFIESMNAMSSYMSSHSNKDINLRVSGESDKYVSIDGSDTQTVSLTAKYALDKYNYTVTGEFTHTNATAKVTKVKSAADFSNAGVLTNFYTDLITYLNPTNYDFQPSVESKDVFVDALIKFANEESKGKIKLNKVSAVWFIKRYSNIEDVNALSVRDKERYDIYTKFKSTIQGILTQGSKSAGTTERYSQVSAALPNNLTAQYTVNTGETTSDLLVVDVTYTNGTGADVAIDNSQYKLVGDSGSSVTANDATLIQGYDANFDMHNVASTVTVSNTLQTKLYFVRHIDSGSANITFADTNLGALVNL